jgi:hypothetical protein
MTADSDSDRQQQWTFVVRRSFGIPDHLGTEEARRELVMCLEEQFLENGWRSAPRAIADPMVDALMALGVSGDPEDRLFNAERSVFSDPFPTRDAAHQLIDKALTIVDPEHLVVDPTSEYPPEIVAAAQVALDRVFRYADEQPFGE